MRTSPARLDILFLFLLALPVWCAPQCLAGEKTAVLATLPEYAPYCFVSDGAEVAARETLPPGKDSNFLRGYAWDVVRESLHSQGYTLTLVTVPWSRALHLAKSGQVDAIFPTGVSMERKKSLDFSIRPVVENSFLVYTAKGSDLSCENMACLGGKKIAVMRGWTYGDAWDQAGYVRKVPVESLDQGFMLLDRGRVDGFAGYEMVWDDFLQKTGEKDQYKKLPHFGFGVEFLAGKKGSPRVRQVLADYDRGKEEITSNGTMEKIAAKYR